MAHDDVKTFRGRSLAEVLPQIRAELGPDAVVLRRREGLTGGIGGFFQRSYVEVEAAGPDGADPMHVAAEAALEARNDRATAEGFASPAIQLLLDQAAPFADQLQSAQRADRSGDTRAADILGSTAPADPGLYGPQPNLPPPPEPAVTAPAPEPELVAEALVPAAPEGPGTPVPVTALLGTRPAAAATAERRLVLAGLDSALAADVVGEAMVHGVPFASPRSLKKLVRSALARRIGVLSPRGPLPRSLAFVGAAGSGRTSAAGHLAAAYAEAGSLRVLAVTLRAADGGAQLRERLAPAGVAVHAAADGAEARRIIEIARGAMVVVDTPGVSLRDARGIEALTDDLRVLALDEVHLVVPATVSAAAAAELAEALEDIGLTHVALTRMDETEHPGAPVGFSISSGGPLSYLCARDGLEPADAATLAQRLLP